jgi:beta-N-acetylhexosaminidase
MTAPLDFILGQQFLVSFRGKTRLPKDIQELIARQPIAGVELLRHFNMGTLSQLRSLTAQLQRAAARAGQGRLLIAANQEGGQLIGVGGSTPFAGNMALGAVGSIDLARRVGRAMGRELAAVGINVNFAPVADVNHNPHNPVIGTRSFGDDPHAVARLTVALARGVESAGVAATVKHFPGHGDTATDSHLGLPVLHHGWSRMNRVELPPFEAAARAGVKLIMTAHVALPRIIQPPDLPATLSPTIVRDLLRRRLRYRGIIATDAMDMRALDQGPGRVVEALAALSAGSDLLLFYHPLHEIPPTIGLMRQAVQRGLLSEKEVRASASRILALKRWLGGRKQPPLSTVGGREHRRLAGELAARSVTLVRDRAGRVPIALPRSARIAVVVPQPKDLTSADTSSYQIPELAAAVRRHHHRTDSFLYLLEPSPSDIRALVSELSRYDLVILGTINAAEFPGQAAFVGALLARKIPTIVAALRLPYDLVAFPNAPTYVCSYSILPPSMNALADALWGRAGFPGRLPVRLPLR